MDDYERQVLKEVRGLLKRGCRAAAISLYASRMEVTEAKTTKIVNNLD